MMKHERTERLLHYVNFTEERCGLIIEHHIQFVWHVWFIIKVSFLFFSFVFFFFGGGCHFCFPVFEIWLRLSESWSLLSFLLDYEKIEDDDRDASSGEDDPNPQTAQVVINEEYV